MKKYLTLLLSAVLVFCLAACSGMNAQQAQACDEADLALGEFVDYLNEGYEEDEVTTETERKIIDKTALYIIHLRFINIDEVSSDLAQTTANVLEDEIEGILSDGDVEMVVYIYGTDSESQYRIVDNDIPSSVASQLD